MLLNVVWATHKDRLIGDIEDRRITIETKGTDFVELSILGETAIWSGYEKEPTLIRETRNNSVTLTAMTDKPFSVEILDTSDESVRLISWDGIGWMLEDHDKVDEHDGWIDLCSLDSESLVMCMAISIGLGHLTTNTIRDTNVFVELIPHEDFENHHIRGDHFFYRDDDHKETQYTMECNDIPPIEELDMLHCFDTYREDDKLNYNHLNTTIYVFFDKEEGVYKALNCCFGDGWDVTSLTSTSDDIVDMKEDVKLAIENDHLTSHFYIVSYVSENKSLTRLFINMERFFPLETPYMC